MCEIYIKISNSKEEYLDMFIHLFSASKDFKENLNLFNNLIKNNSTFFQIFKTVLRMV